MLREYDGREIRAEVVGTEEEQWKMNLSAADDDGKWWLVNGGVVQWMMRFDGGWFMWKSDGYDLTGSCSGSETEGDVGVGLWWSMC